MSTDISGAFSGTDDQNLKGTDSFTLNGYENEKKKIYISSILQRFGTPQSTCETNLNSINNKVLEDQYIV